MNANVNNAGFVNFKNRDFKNAGTRNTWVKVQGNEVTVSIASKGTIGSAYLEEIEQFLSSLGLGDFYKGLKCGDKKTVYI